MTDETRRQRDERVRGRLGVPALRSLSLSLSLSRFALSIALHILAPRLFKSRLSFILLLISDFSELRDNMLHNTCYSVGVKQA